MRHRSPARWLAPLALVTCAVAVYVVADRGLRSDGGDATTATSTAAARSTATQPGRASTVSSTTRKTYTVKSGDVLSAIAEKTGVDVAELQRLNPDVEAATLRPGQKLKLR